MSERTVVVTVKPAWSVGEVAVGRDAIAAYLLAQGVPLLADGVVVYAGGEVELRLPDAAAIPAAVAALDALDPAGDDALTPESRAFNDLIANVEAAQQAVIDKGAAARTDGEKLALAVSRLLLRLHKRVAP